MPETYTLTGSLLNRVVEAPDFNKVTGFTEYTEGVMTNGSSNGKILDEQGVSEISDTELTALVRMSTVKPNGELDVRINAHLHYSGKTFVVPILPNSLIGNVSLFDKLIEDTLTQEDLYSLN